ncbi:MAG: ABC transporter ATP-binding protein [bacterium]
MTAGAIRVESLSKRYRIGTREPYRTLRDSIVAAIRLPLRRIARRGSHPGDMETIWALKDVSLEVGEGEVLGIIGRNGAGKTTLLKILSRITQPTEGKVTLFGRVASLLEVGTGFHPELTGRENIYLNGAILGMNRFEIGRKFDEIVSFAEIEQFLDTPVKRYSSGMYMRLAFAVAAHLEPEILLVDEVLAVGDAAFQKKCLGKMGAVAREGRTVLFVSHNMAAIRSLCTRAILLESGRVRNSGCAEDIISEYLGMDGGTAGERVWSDSSDAPGDSDLRIRAVRVRNSGQEVSSSIKDSEDMYVDIEYQASSPLRDVRLGFYLLTTDGTVVLTTGDGDGVSGTILREPGFYRARCRIPKYFLNSGSYVIKLFGHIPGIRLLFDGDVLLPFSVTQTTEIGGHGRSPGFIRTLFDWDTKRVALPEDARNAKIGIAATGRR